MQVPSRLPLLLAPSFQCMYHMTSHTHIHNVHYHTMLNTFTLSLHLHNRMSHYVPKPAHVKLK